MYDCLSGGSGGGEKWEYFLAISLFSSGKDSLSLNG